MRYDEVSRWLLSCVLLFIVVNLCAGAILWAKDALNATKDPSTKYGTAAMRERYPGLSSEAIGTLLEETWTRPLRFEAFTQFKEGPHSGQYVRVSDQGFRKSRLELPWPPVAGRNTIFAFGGSTTFGYGLPDQDTVVSALEGILNEIPGSRADIYNFGRAYYYSSQEFILFTKLLRSGMVPKIAVFIDGLNEFYYDKDEPEYSGALSALFKSPSEASELALALRGVAAALPIVKLASRLTRGKQPRGGVAQQVAGPAAEERVERAIARYIENKRLIEAVAREYGVVPLFVWQPVPTYKYDISDHIATMADLGEHAYSELGYSAMRERLDRIPGERVIWCADIQVGRRSALYVDAVHYSAYLSRLLSECVAPHVRARAR